MVRAKSDNKRNALINAATRVIARDGIGAATGTIAREAGVASGSLFTYFTTKVVLLNDLYVELKTEMADAALAGLPTDGNLRSQLMHVWSRWLWWAASSPDKRGVLAKLSACHEITPTSHQAASGALAPLAKLLDEARAHGALHDVSLDFVLAIASAIADATADRMIAEPATADHYCAAAFDALWRMIA